MSKSYKSTGLSLVEVMVVISLISLLALMSYSSVMDDLEFNEFSQAARRATVIATAIENAKSFGVVTPPFSGSLGSFVSAHGAANIDSSMSILNSTPPYFGSDADVFFDVLVNEYTTLVSFTIRDSRMFSFSVPSLGRTENRIDGDGAVTSITWTASPSAGSGLYVAYKLGQLVNED